MKIARIIAFDLDGTLVGFRGRKLILNAEMVKMIQHTKKNEATIILWTFGTREWWDGELRFGNI